MHATTEYVGIRFAGPTKNSHWPSGMTGIGPVRQFLNRSIS
jgi:hypothetical protein